MAVALRLTDEGTARSAENIVVKPFLPLTRTLISRLRRQLLLKGEAMHYSYILLRHGRAANFFDTLTPRITDTGRNCLVYRDFDKTVESEIVGIAELSVYVLFVVAACKYVRSDINAHCVKFRCGNAGFNAG